MSFPILLAAGIGFVLLLASIRFVFRFLLIPIALALGIFILLGSGTRLANRLATSPHVRLARAPTFDRGAHGARPPQSPPAQPLVSAFLNDMRSVTARIRHAIHASAHHPTHGVTPGRAR